MLSEYIFICTLIYNCFTFLIKLSLYGYVMLFFVSGGGSWLKVYFADRILALSPCCFDHHLQNLSFPLLYFQPVFLNTKWVSQRQNVVGSYSFIQLLFPLIGEFNSLMLNWQGVTCCCYFIVFSLSHRSLILFFCPCCFAAWVIQLLWWNALIPLSF